MNRLEKCIIGKSSELNNANVEKRLYIIIHLYYMDKEEHIKYSVLPVERDDLFEAAQGHIKLHNL